MISWLQWNNLICKVLHVIENRCYYGDWSHVSIIRKQKSTAIAATKAKWTISKRLNQSNFVLEGDNWCILEFWLLNAKILVRVHEGIVCTISFERPETSP